MEKGRNFSYKGENRQKEESRLNMANRLDCDRREKEGEQERSSRPRRAAWVKRAGSQNGWVIQWSGRRKSGRNAALGRERFEIGGMVRSTEVLNNAGRADCIYFDMLIDTSASHLSWVSSFFNLNIFFSILHSNYSFPSLHFSRSPLTSPYPTPIHSS